MRRANVLSLDYVLTVLWKVAMVCAVAVLVACVALIAAFVVSSVM